MHTTTTSTRWCVVLLTIFQSVNAFTLSPAGSVMQISTTTPGRNFYSQKSIAKAKTFLHLSSKNEQEEGVKKEDDGSSAAPTGMSFEDATAALKDQEDAERAAARGAMLEEDKQNFQAKKTEFDEMRKRIRSRASDLNMKKSEATAEAIKAATQRARAGEEAATPTVDLSKFSSSLAGPDEEDPEDVLTDEQKKEIDKVGQLPLWEQVGEELKNTKFPSPDATLKQALLMVVIFIVTAGVILKADELLRYQITEWGFIPRSGEVLDYSDLTLPEGFTDSMTDIDLANL